MPDFGLRTNTLFNRVESNDEAPPSDCVEVKKNATDIG
jgi:hypothetical protein